MAFKRLSLRGFSSDYNIRRRVERYTDTHYRCRATLYWGSHFRIKLDEIDSLSPYYGGMDAADELVDALRGQLVERYELESAPAAFRVLV